MIENDCALSDRIFKCICTICWVDLKHDVWKKEIRWIFWSDQKFEFLICRVLTFSENPLARMFEHTFWALIWEFAQPILWIAWEKCLWVNMASNDQLPPQQLAKVYGGTLCLIFWAWTQISETCFEAVSQEDCCR